MKNSPIEENRNALAVLICIFVFLFWYEWQIAPANRAANRRLEQNQELPKKMAEQPIVSARVANDGDQDRNLKNGVILPSIEEIEKEGIINVRGEKIDYQLTLLGGRLKSFKLLNYKAKNRSDQILDMVSGGEDFELPLGLFVGNKSDAKVLYKLVEVNDKPYEKSLSKNIFFPLSVPVSELSLTLEGELEGVGTIRKKVFFSDETYLGEVSVKLNSFENLEKRPQPLWINWNHLIDRKSLEEQINPTQISSLQDNKLHLFKEINTDKRATPHGLAEWIALGNKYFLAALISPNLARVATDRAQSERLQTATLHTDNFSSVYFGGVSDYLNIKIYLGPKYYDRLKKLGYELHRAVDLGIFAFVAHPLLFCIKFFYGIFGNYGLAIILLTLLIKFIFLPLTKTSLESMKAMQSLQPEITSLKERIKDPTELNKAMMKLYKDRGVNPMGGCLPIVIQIPVFLGLYNALNNSIELRHANFALWINDLSAPERLNLLGMGIPVMVLIMGASMIIQQLTAPAVGDPAQRRTMLIMSVVFTVIFMISPFPSGLVLYWLINNIISIVQQYFLKSEKIFHPYRATIMASLAIFVFGYILTLI